MTDDNPRKRELAPRSRKRRRLRATDPFADTPSGDNPLSVSAADAALFGEIRAREGARPTLRLLDIHDIQPDPQQPRRSLPRHLRQQFDGRTSSIPDLLIHWREAVAPDVHLRAALALSEDEWAEPVGEPAFAELLALAASIRHDGLQHPITVARDEHGGFLLESGERRWLAFHLLTLYDREGERWARIPANIQPERDVWRQASENSARDDLNAIARARQYALLLMDLWRERGHEFRPLADFAHEQAFYAQASDHRPPYGSGARLLNAMGRQHRNAFMRCRQLLDLPRPLWERGDEENWSEDQLLQSARAGTSRPQDAKAAPTTATTAKDSRIKDTPSPWERQFARWQRQLNPAKLHRLPAPQRHQLREWLRGLLKAMGEE